MWDIGGHEIELGGGPYTTDWGDPCVMIHCNRCPDGSTDAWRLWSDPDETGEAISPGTGVAVVSGHLRRWGVDISTEAEEGATFMGQLANEVEVGLRALADHVNDSKSS